MVSRGEYLHFRCDKHSVEGHVEAGKVACYRCSYPGCNRAAKAYWYRGEDYATLPTMVIISGAYDSWLPP